METIIKVKCECKEKYKTTSLIDSCLEQMDGYCRFCGTHTEAECKCNDYQYNGEE